MIDPLIFKTHMFCPTRTIGYELVERTNQPAVKRPVYKFGVPIFLWGPPGVGKTEQARQLAEAFGLGFGAEPIAQRDPSEINGMMTVDANGKLVQNLPPWASKHAGPAVTLFDEFVLAPKMSQDACLTTVNDSSVGGVFLQHMRFIVAGNEARIGGGREPSPAVANRFGHYEVGPDAGAWCEWMISGGDMGAEVEPEDAHAIEQFVAERFDEPYARQRGLLVGFVRNGGTDATTLGTGRLFSMPDKSSPQSRRAWLSPRSLEKVARMRATAEVFGLSDELRDEITAALVGADTAALIGQYETDNDMPNVADWLDDKASWEFNPQRPDRAVTLFSAAASLVLPDEAHRRIERAKSFWTKIEPIAAEHPDLVLMAAQAVTLKKLPTGGTRATGLASFPEAQPTLRKLRPIMVAVGMLAPRD